MNPFSDEPHPDWVGSAAFRSWIIDLNDDREFEELVRDIYSRLDWNTELTQATRDGGYDIRLEKMGQSKLVEVKHSPNIGPSVVREISGTALAENVTTASVIAISFTSSAKEVATKIQENSHLEVELRDANKLHETFEKVEMWDLMDEYSVEHEPRDDGLLDRW